MAKNQCELTYYERQIIEVRLRCKQSIREIAEHLHRDHTVIAREIKRNKPPRQKYYIALVAQELADRRKRKTNKRKLLNNEELRTYVLKKLVNEGWSPEQIAGRLKKHPPKNLQGARVNYESIYQYIYEEEWWLYRYLKKKKTYRRQRRYKRKINENSLILGRISIHDRPARINERKEAGHWESDTVCFRKQKAALSVQLERISLLVRFHRVENKTSNETHKAIQESIESLPQYLWNSITFDNGKEGVCHSKLKDEYNLNTYFCDPYCSWQKGSVENINGLIRHYLPRSADMSKITKEMLYEIQEKLNNRPRKKLGFLTPNEYIKRYL